MKLVYISSSAIPSRLANSIQVMRMCEAFAKAGLNVTLLAPDLPTEAGIDDWYRFYGVEPVFEIQKIWVPGGVAARPLLYGLIAGLRARRLAADVVYGRSLPGCFFSALLGLRVVFEAHSPIEQGTDPKRRLRRRMFEIMVRSKGFSRLVVLSRSLLELYRKRYPTLPIPALVAYNGANSVPEIPAVDLHGNSEFNVGYIGHLYQGKGMELVAEMVERCPWAHFHIIGGTDEDRRHWESALARFPNVTFYGHVPPAVVSGYRLAMDVLVLPSQRTIRGYQGNTFEQWWSPPLKLFEYMSSGKPIIASNFLDEVLVHGETGLLASPTDVDEWIRALNQLRTDTQLRKRLGENARKEFEAKYTWDARARRIINAIVDSPRLSAEGCDNGDGSYSTVSER